jgi:pre-mRNA-splicing factor ISY1
VSDIQNASLGEHRIRDLNDEINALLKEKSNWEDHIRELGGPDYKSAALAIAKTAASFDTDGLELPGAEGYKYFGAAKNLPKVRELFQKELPTAPKISRVELYKRVSYRYLGYGANL